MKKHLKFGILLLALCMLLSAFVACDTEEAETNKPAGDDQSNNGSEEVVEVLPDVEKKNYGESFYITNQSDVNPMKYYWVEESEGDIMSDAIYARQMNVKEYLGVEVFASYAGRHTVYTEGFKTSIKNKDDSVHLMLSHVHSGIEGLITGGYLFDFQDLPGIDLDADYWNYDYMENLALNDHFFFGYSDFNILYTYVIAFNKTLMDQYSGNFDESVYDMVINYHWTLDKMISIANLVYIDDGDGVKDEGDTFGIVGNQWVPFVGFMQAVNIQLVEENEKGIPALACYTETTAEKTVELVNKLQALTFSDTAWFWYRDETTPKVSLDSNQALMSLTSTFGLPDLAQKDVSFGVLPYPMWDEAQKDVGYRSLQWGGYQLLPAYMKNPQMVGETLELLCYYSKEVNQTFYEKLLGKQAAEAPLDKQMLDIIWDSVCSDLGQTFHDLGAPLYLIPQESHKETPTVASTISSLEGAFDRAVQKFLKIVSKAYD